MVWYSHLFQNFPQFIVDSDNIILFIIFMCMCSVAQACPTLCDPMDCSLPGSSVHGILQAGVLEWVIIFYSRGCSRLDLKSLVSFALRSGFITTAPLGKLQKTHRHLKISPQEIWETFLKIRDRNRTSCIK